MSDALLLWPLAYLVHSTLLLGAAWIAGRWIRHAVLAEALWRCAFFGAFVTAAVSSFAPFAFAFAPAPLAAPVRALAVAPAEARVTPARVQAAARPAPAAAPVMPAPAVADAAPAGRWSLPPGARLLLLAATPAWSLVALAGLASLLLQWIALRRAWRRLRPNVDGGWTQAAQELARHYGLRRTPALKVGATWASPLVGPRGEVGLPDWCLAQLPPAQRDAVLAHELAHLSRHDPAWRVASRIAACVGWLQPLNVVALRRLDALAEQVCDARAARAVADRHAVAEALYLCASRLQSGRRAPGLNVGMATARSPLLRRVEQLMRHDPAQERRGGARRGWVVGAVVLVAVACLLPALKVRGGELRSSAWRDILADSLPSVGQRTHVMTRSPGDDIDVWIRDNATLRDDSDALKSGRVTLSEKTGGVTRRLEIDADTTATATQDYQLDGAPRPFDADAKQWAAMRWNIVVGALLNPNQRVDRLLRRGGPEQVLQAIEKPVDIGTQHALIEAYAGTRSLDAPTVQRLIAAADRAEPGGDDHDRVLSLRDIARRQRLTPEQQQQVVTALLPRAGDGDAGAALQALLVQLGARTQVETLTATAAAIRALPSDNARREVLNMALDVKTPVAVDLALQVTPVFTSDYDHRDLLEHVAKRLAGTDNPELIERFTDSAHALKSPYDRRTALLALIESAPLHADGCMAVLNALDGLDSAADVTPVLLALAKKMPPDSGLIARYRQIARVLPTFERGQAEQALDAMPLPD